MYDEFNPLEHVLLEDALDVAAGLGRDSGGGVHFGVSGGVSNLMGVLGKLIFRALIAALRSDRLRFGFAIPGTSMGSFLDPLACCWRVPVVIPRET